MVSYELEELNLPAWDESLNPYCSGRWSRTRTHQLGIELTPDGRVPNGTAPILVGVGFTKDDDGNVVFGGGNHVMIAGNFATVFAGKTCKECAEAYDKAVKDKKKVVMKATKSARGKIWSEFSIKK